MHHKVLNVEKIQLTFSSSLTITLAEAVNLEVNVKKWVSRFTVKTLSEDVPKDSLLVCTFGSLMYLFPISTYPPSPCVQLRTAIGVPTFLLEHLCSLQRCLEAG